MNPFNIFAKSYPFDAAWESTLKRSVAYGCFVALFLFFFKPFGLGDGDLLLLAITCALFGGITFGIMLANGMLLPKLLPQFFQENWTVGWQILFTGWIIALIGLGNTILLTLFGWSPIPFWQMLLNMECYTLSVGIIPVSFYTIYHQNQLLKQHLSKAAQWNGQLENKPNPLVSAKKEKVDETIQLADEKGNVEVVISPDQLGYAIADGNYLDLYLLDDDKLSKKTLRNRLKYLEGKLPEAQFFRSHRSHLVNLRWVTAVNGNARGYALHLLHTPDTVPVSRNNIRKMEELLSAVL